VAPTAPSKETPAARRGARPSWTLAVLLALPAAATVAGLPYYLAERAERVRSPLHAGLKSSGAVGLAFGIAGLALFLFMWLYPLRKRFAKAPLGRLSSWLDVHIACGIALPFVVAVHAGWRFTGLIGLGYLAMVLVAASGVVGRYLYVRIPRSRSGLELTLDEALAERHGLITRIAVATRQDPMVVQGALVIGEGTAGRRGLWGSLTGMVGDDLARWRTMRDLRRRWAGHVEPAVLAEALRLARRELALTQQLRMLEATRRVFGLWHVAHRPFAISALLAVLVHVAVALAVGAVRFG
jgi:hypothetical protein